MTTLLRAHGAPGAPLTRPELMDRLGTAEALRANMVVSVDGRAAIEGRVGGLTGPADQELLVALRGWCDVLMVGAGTVRAEGYGVIRLPEEISRVRRLRGQPDHPVLAVLSGSLDLDPGLSLFSDADPQTRPWLITVPGHDPDRLARFEQIARIIEVAANPQGRPDLAHAVTALRAAGMGRILSEGGPTVLGELIERHLVDELFVTISPQVLGGRALGLVEASRFPDPQRLALIDVLTANDELFLRYRVQR